MLFVVDPALTASEGKALFTTTLDVPPPPYGIALRAPGTANGPRPLVLCLRLECTLTVTLFDALDRAVAEALAECFARFDLLRPDRGGGMVLS